MIKITIARIQWFWIFVACGGLGLAMLGSLPGAGIFAFSLLMVFIIEWFKGVIKNEH